MTTLTAAPSRPTMLAPDEALRLVVEAAEPLPSRAVPLGEACGLELAEPVLADRDYPPFARAMMDGYAVRTADAGHCVTVVGEVAAGQTAERRVAEGRSLEIMTGAPCPAGTEAVVPRELARRDGNTVRLPRRIDPGQHIAPQASECAAGQVVLRPGETLTPLGVAVAASFGLGTIRVTPKPTLGIITTGAELAPPAGRLAPGQIRDSNGPMLAAMASDLGLDGALLHADDKLEAIVAALDETAVRDVVVLTGGVSVGNYDLVPQALRESGAEIVFHKVRQKPGKPLLFARRGRQLVFGLPGNPLACHLCFHRYVTAAVRKMSGKHPAAEKLFGELTEPVGPKSGRTYFVAATAEQDRQTGRWQVRPVPGTSSADIFASCRANCYVEVPPGNATIPAGTVLPFSRL